MHVAPRNIKPSTNHSATSSRQPTTQQHQAVNQPLSNIKPSTNHSATSSRQPTTQQHQAVDQPLSNIKPSTNHSAATNHVHYCNHSMQLRAHLAAGLPQLNFSLFNCCIQKPDCLEALRVLGLHGDLVSAQGAATGRKQPTDRKFGSLLSSCVLPEYCLNDACTTNVPADCGQQIYRG
jgi:membrane peptidoglycan carboxypeptidase